VVAPLEAVEDCPVEETIVWMVPIRRGEPTEQRGVLSLEDVSLVFTERREGDRTAIPLGRIRKVKRVRGSPILMVRLEDRTGMAFYFAQPPPLKPVPRAPEADGRRYYTAFSPGAGRTAWASKKKVMRTNVTYLSSAGIEKKEEIECWVRAIRDKIKDG